MRPLFRLLLTVILPVAAGCGGSEFVAATGSAEDGGPTSSDGGMGPTDATTSTDGSFRRDGAPGAGDASDATIGVGEAGAGDATTSEGGPATFSCSALTGPTIVFCSDFDEQAVPPWNWSSDPVTAKGSDAIDTVDFLSPPNGFAAKNSLLLPTDQAQIASLGKPFVSLAPHIDYAFQMFVKTYDTLDNPPLPVAQLAVGTPSALSLQLVLQAGQLHLVQLFNGTDGGPQMPSVVVGSVTTGAWTPVDLLLNRGGPTWTVSVYLGGVLKLTAQSAATPSDQNLEVDLGILEIVPPSNANAVTFDNVVVRAY